MTARRDGAILRLTLDRPARRNSLTHLMIETLVGALTEAAADDSLRAIHLRRRRRGLLLGRRLGGHQQRHRAAAAHRRSGAHGFRTPPTALIELVHTIQLPVVCSVRGWAVGMGCNLALAADFAVAATDAVFWEPFIDRGFSPDSGATWLLPRLVGVARARRMLLLGEKVSAARCGRLGPDPPSRRPGPNSTTTAESCWHDWPAGRRSRSGWPSRP